MKDGIININKPKGMTSNDVIYQLKKILGIKKLGHTGTLDPLATGVLPICINKATRVAEYMDIDSKTYRCKMKLGIITESQDITGKVIYSADRASESINGRDLEIKKSLDALSEGSVRKAFEPFSGLVEQLPPLYSAVKIDGKPLYEYAYKGDAEEIRKIRQKMKPRQVYLYDIKIEEVKLPHVVFQVKCSKGTYIRTICQDVGDSLGCGATLVSLERLSSGAFNIENSVTLKTLQELAVREGRLNENYELIKKGFLEEIPTAFEPYVVGVDFPLGTFGIGFLNQNQAKKFIDGWHIPCEECEVIRESSYRPPVDYSLLKGADMDSENYHSGSYGGLKIKKEYQRAYKLYVREDNESRTPKSANFLGVAIYSDKYHKLVADKVFYRRKQEI